MLSRENDHQRCGKCATKNKLCAFVYQNEKSMEENEWKRREQSMKESEMEQQMEQERGSFRREEKGLLPVTLARGHITALIQYHTWLTSIPKPYATQPQI